MAIENDTYKMKLGNGKDLYKNLPYINLTPDELDKLEKSIEARLGEKITIQKIMVNDEEIIPEEGIVSLSIPNGKLASKDSISVEDLDEELQEAIQVKTTPLFIYESFEDFPENGDSSVTYLDEETTAVYRFKDGKYYRIGIDYTQIKVINGGNSENGRN